MREFSGKMPGARERTPIYITPPLTLTVRTPQCGHTVLGAKDPCFIVGVYPHVGVPSLGLVPDWLPQEVFLKGTTQSVILEDCYAENRTGHIFGRLLVMR
jgi:hypothetical protein